MLDPLGVQRLFSAGDCPTCGGSGTLIFLRPTTLEQLVLFCPLCAVAWREHPNGRIDSILSLSDVAPSGVVLPTESHVSTYGDYHEIDYLSWLPLLADEIEASYPADL